MGTSEANFDGLVGPTHNYAGLAHGNVASQANRRMPANPRSAALQGLEKMRRLHEMGLRQAILPPLPRPALPWLRGLGFAGTDAEVIARVAKSDPVLLAAAYSASSMWTANAATISPAADSGDGKVHLTPANLSSQMHRALEAGSTAALLKAVFPGERFVHHAPLPAGRPFGDEGAANHIRLAPSHGSPGIQVFVYGQEAGRAAATRKYFPRQTLEASRAVARLHGLADGRLAFAAQHPKAIDAGVFHNDVISVGNEGVLFCHESAFRDRAAALRELKRKYAALGAGPLQVIEVGARELSLAAAVSTYLFNSQLLSLPNGGMLLLAATECEAHPRTRKFLAGLTGRGPIAQVAFADLRQSMRNGGGPACLRLRVVLTELEWGDVPAGVKFGEATYLRLKAWIESRYRDRLLPADLADPDFLEENRLTTRGLYEILELPRGLAE